MERLSEKDWTKYFEVKIYIIKHRDWANWRCWESIQKGNHDIDLRGKQENPINPFRGTKRWKRRRNWIFQKNLRLNQRFRQQIGKDFKGLDGSIHSIIGIRRGWTIIRRWLITKYSGQQRLSSWPYLQHQRNAFRKEEQKRVINRQWTVFERQRSLQEAIWRETVRAQS